MCKLFVFVFLAIFSIACDARRSKKFRKLIAFGDSITDDGVNVVGDRHGFKEFCAGDIWSDYLERSLNVEQVNYAYSGAKSDYGTYWSFNWSGGLWQVDEYLKDVRGRVPRKALIAIQTMGLNDYWDNTNVTACAVAENFREMARRLLRAKAKHVLVLNLFAYGLVPGVRNDTDFKEGMDNFAREINPLLAQHIANLQNEFRRAKIYLADIENVLIEVENAGRLITYPYFSHYVEDLEPFTALNYAYYDDYHPATTVHSIMATRALSALND